MSAILYTWSYASETQKETFEDAYKIVVWFTMEELTPDPV